MPNTPAIAMASKNSVSTSMPAGWVQCGFPQTTSELKQSVKFCKRLIAIGFSQILYLRSEVDDSCFKDYQCGGINLKMLKGKSSSEQANKLTQRLKNAMDALDKGYLRELVIVIMEDKTKPEEAFETYSFIFGDPKAATTPGSTGFKLTHTSNGESTIISENDPSNMDDPCSIYRATKKLLKKMFVQIQELGDLPETAYMTVQIGYHDENTPDDYCPPGFRNSTEGKSFVQNAPSKHMGKVQTSHHSIDVVLASKAVQVNEEQIDANASHIDLQPGLDQSAMEQSLLVADDEMGQGSSVENVAKPKAYGDVQTNGINEISDKLKNLDSHDQEQNKSANTFESDTRSTRMGPVRKMASRRDTFKDKSKEHIKASTSKALQI